MATDEESETKQGFPLNATTLLALLTVAAGLFAAVHRLASDRPRVSVGRHNEEISEQKVDTWLWEDPFNALGKENARKQLGNLPEELAATEKQRLRILAVMIPGGPSSESREARVRSRFALVSALAQSGYAPENPEHIGIDEMPWPSSLHFHNNTTSRSRYPDKPPRLSPTGPEIAKAPVALSSLTEANEAPGTLALSGKLEQRKSSESSSGNLHYAFEWYRPERFVAHPNSIGPNEQRLVLIWLDEDAFDDYPASRLGLFLHQLSTGNLEGSSCWTDSWPNVQLIGPRLSSTLARFFQPQDGPKEHLDLLQHVSLFLAIPRALDEVLFPANPGECDDSRSQVITNLTPQFHEVKNFAATDGSLAHEAMEELAARGIDLTHTNEHHLVLLAGWDNFFGRMVSAAYAAELACRQRVGLSRMEFLNHYSTGAEIGPANLHTFFYLSGLDGQGLSDSAPEANPPSDSAKPSESWVSGAKNSWTPDVNRAEGPAQLDYLGRLADRIDGLEHQLRRDHRGRVSAIGIAGGDLYDTLLILQALRARFPSAVFFTTDLDARFWDPKEWAWSRNLVVVSGYGIQLDPSLQGPVAPFRDSVQTAQYAAALAALGNANLVQLKRVPVRRFEVGRRGPVDLSNVDPTNTPVRLHPSRDKVGFSAWLRYGRHLALAFILLGGVGFVLLASKNARRFTLDRHRFMAEPLWIKEEDVGGEEGFLAMACRMKRGVNDSKTAGRQKWLLEKISTLIGLVQSDQPGSRGLNELIFGSKADEPGFKLASQFKTADEQAKLRRLLHEFLDDWNASLGRDDWRDGGDSALGELAEKMRKNPRTGSRSHEVQSAIELDRLQINRGEADRLVKQLLPVDDDWQEDDEDDFSFARAAASAREVAWKLFRLHTWRLAAFLVVAVLALLGGVFLTAKTLADPASESMTLSGTSVWPTIWICFVGLILILVFIVESYFQLRKMVMHITRRCRLCFQTTSDKTAQQGTGTDWRVLRQVSNTTRRWVHSMAIPAPRDAMGLVHANAAWSDYQMRGSRRCRIWRTACLTFAYFVLVTGIYFLITDQPSVPFIRGDARDVYSFFVNVGFILALFLCFWTIDAALLCRWFIQSISEGPTQYPAATRKYYSRLSGGAPDEVLADWIDVQIIAEITAKVQRLIYFPAIALFILILAHHRIWYDWPWPKAAYLVALCNFAVAVSSVVILQKAARRARDLSASNLEEKLHQLKAGGDITLRQRRAREVSEAERLLGDIRGLSTGAFAGFWGNPVVGALLVPSGGAAFLEILHQLLAQ